VPFMVILSLPKIQDKDSEQLLPTWDQNVGECPETPGHSLGKPGSSSPTCVLGAGQGQSQGPERDQLSPAGTHGVA
jgi:hypothetical protein